MEANAEKAAWAKEHETNLLLTRSDREDKDKAAGLTDEGTGLPSNVEGDGCYGEWAKVNKLLQPNTSDSEKNTTGERIGQDTDSFVTPIDKKHCLLFNATSSEHDKIIKSQFFGLGQAQMNITERHILGLGQLLDLG